MVSLRHDYTATGTNNPDKQVSVDRWNAEHDLTGTAGTVLGFDAAGQATELSATFTAASRAALAAYNTAAGAVYLTEPGREGTFVWSSANNSANVTSDPNQGTYVAPSTDGTGASGAWVRKFNGPHNVKWFGATGDGVTNDGAAVLAAIAHLAATTGPDVGFGSGAPTLYFPFGEYYLGTNKLTLSVAMGMIGESGATFGGVSTLLRWDAGTTGIKLDAQNCYIDGLTLKGGWVDSTTAEGSFHGIHAKYKFGWGRLYITNWQGDGIHVDTTTDAGNFNGAYGASLTVNNCRSGVDITGGDANGGNLGFIDANANRRAGVRDDSAYGNHYTTIQAASNGVQGIAGTAPVCVYQTGHIYTVAKGQATGASTNAPSGAATSNTYWIYWKDAGAATAYAPQWVSGTTYRDGGAILVTGASNSTTVGHLYTESDQPPVQMEQSSFSIGGTNAAGLEATTRRIHADANGINLSPRARVNGDAVVTGQMSVVASGTGQATFILQNDTGSLSNLLFKHSNGSVTDAQIMGWNGTGLIIDAYTTGDVRSSGSTAFSWNANGLNIASGHDFRLNNTVLINSSGVLQAVSFPALTGDVTTAGGALATTLSSATVVSKIAAQALAPASVAATAAITSSSASAGIGYATGAGGAVTQLTSRTTGVTLDKVCGQITLFSAAGSATFQTFTVTNAQVAAGDVVVACQKSGTDLYHINVTNVAAGSFKISFATTGGTTTEQPVFSFAVIKAVAA